MERYTVKEVPTQTVEVIEDTKEEGQLTPHQLMVRVANDVLEMKENLLGK